MVHNASPKSAKRTYPDRIKSIQFLRWVAATLVVLYHSDLQIIRLFDGKHLHPFGFAAAGTDMLFVISGFIMVLISDGKRPSFWEFMFRRVARIAPLYWLLTLLMVAAFLVAPRLFNSTAFDLPHVLASLAFLPYPHPVLGTQRPFLFPGWALNHFMFFYIVFAFFLFLPTMRRIAAVSLTLCSLVALWLLFFGANPLLDFYGAPMVLDFVFGMLVAGAYLLRNAAGVLAIAIAVAASATIFGIGMLGQVSVENDRFLYWGLAGTALLFSFVFIEKQWGWCNPALVTQLGEASFAIYLSNLFTLAIVAKALEATGLFRILGIAGSQILMVVTALAAGWAINVLAERPLHALVLRNEARLLDGARRLRWKVLKY